MPVFIINLLSEVIFRPFITSMSVNWNNQNIKEFKKLFYRQLIFIFLLTIIMMAGGYIIGLRLLEIVYNVELSQYMSSLQILLIAGGFNTGSVFLTLILTIQREQKKFMVVYLLTTAISLFISDYLVINYEILGASLLYLFICFTFFFTFLFLVLYNIKKEQNKI